MAADPNETLALAGRWLLDDLQRELTGRPDLETYDLAALRPVIQAWFAHRAPGVAPGSDWVSFEVAFTSGTEGGVAVPAPDWLDDDLDWYSVAVLRSPSVAKGPTSRTSADFGINLFWPPSAASAELRDHPQWDTGNLLGFHCLGLAGETGPEWFDTPAIAATFAAFGNEQPSAVQLVGSVLDQDLRLR